MLFNFEIVSRSLCSFCNSEEETPFRIFTTVLTHKIFGIKFRYTLARILPFLFGFIDTQQENCVIKFNIYKSRDLKTLIFVRLKLDIIKIRQIEENLCQNDIQK